MYLIRMKGKRNNFKSKSLKSFVYSSLVLFFLAPNPVPAFAGRINKVSAHSSEPGYNEAIRRVRSFDFDSLRLAITDLTKTFGQSYPKGQEYLEHLNSLEELSKAALSSFNRKDNSAKTALSKLAHDLNKLRYDALLSNPLLDFKRLLLKRRQGQLGLPVNHKCNSGIEQTGYDNEIAVLASVRPGPTGGLESNIVAHFGKGILESAVSGGNVLCDIRFDDGTVATADVGSYQPNTWGLYDMHGNACEWTRTAYRAYPYEADDGLLLRLTSQDVAAGRDYPTKTGPRLLPAGAGRKVVRGGSWCDRPKRCRSAFRLSYPTWQRVHNVGFRVVCEMGVVSSEFTN